MGRILATNFHIHMTLLTNTSRSLDEASLFLAQPFGAYSLTSGEEGAHLSDSGPTSYMRPQPQTCCRVYGTYLICAFGSLLPQAFPFSNSNVF